MTGFVAVTRKNSLDELKALCKLGSSVIKSLVLDQIQTVIPPPGTVATATDPPPNHFDLSTILSVLTSITELQVYYGYASLSAFSLFPLLTDRARRQATRRRHEL